MFWSKIWFFLIALIAAAAVATALLLPRPAQRAQVRSEASQLNTACGVIRILLTDDARNRVELASSFARTPGIQSALEAAGTAEAIDEARMKQVRGVGETVMQTIQGARKPDFAILIDKRGRVVARVRLDEADFGDIAAGRPLIDDALDGYLRDDLWAQNGTMYFVSASPVVKQGSYVGAVVLGHQVTNELAQTLVKSLGVDMAFHLGADRVAGSKTIAFDQGELLAAVGRLTGDSAGDCQAVKPIDVHAAAEDDTVVVARLPGEAGAQRAFYSVILKRPEALGLVGTLKAVKENDLAFANFPWLLVGGGFVVVLIIGIGLMFAEADRPLRRLTHDAVRLAKGEIERISEDAHTGRLGSIARSVNIHIDKLARDAKSAKKDLDQLLGPAPDAGLGTIDLLATGLPPVGVGLSAAPLPQTLPALRPGGAPPASPPPPSEFRFTDSGPTTISAAPRAPAKRSNTPPPFRVTPPPGPAVAPPGVPPPSAPPARPSPASRSQPRMVAQPSPNPFTPSISFDDDILGSSSSSFPGAPEPPVSRVESSAPRSGNYFRQVFDQFVTVKKSCNEPISGLVYERFAEKLEKNREDLMSKTGCRDVRFTVYIKDGKAALKATPVRDDA